MLPIDGGTILRIAPVFSGHKKDAQARIVGAISDQLAPVLDSYDINTRLRIAHFLGQVTHECAGFRTTEEFASGIAYEGRADLGNTERGDGPLFKGRGLLQLTGRANYREMGKRLGMDLENSPEMAGDPVTSLKIACEYWSRRKINDPADQDNVGEVTRRINGGTIGLIERIALTRRAKAVLADIEGMIIGFEQGGTGAVLRRGSSGDAVERLQVLLRSKGFLVAIDGDFGPSTELAVSSFQAAELLTVDGIVGQRTWEQLQA